MKFGMNLLLWTDNLTEEHRPIIEKLKRMGYDGIEAPVLDLNPDKFAAIGLWLDDMGLERTAVTCRGVEDNPASSDAKVRAAGVANNKLALDCCQAAGMNILAGPFHSALGYFTGAGPTSDEWKWAVDSMRQVAEHAEACGVTLAVEYVNRFECYLLNCVADTVRFVKDVDHPHCRMMYDTFHANIEEKNPVEAIRACARDRTRPHFGKRPQHAGPGEHPLGSHVRRAARDGLRRLADDRGLRPGAAGPGRGHENLAADVHDRGAVGPGRPGIYESASGANGPRQWPEPRFQFVLSFKEGSRRVNAAAAKRCTRHLTSPLVGRGICSAFPVRFNLLVMHGPKQPASRRPHTPHRRPWAFA